jgi:hypothetical protein
MNSTDLGMYSGVSRPGNGFSVGIIESTIASHDTLYPPFAYRYHPGDMGAYISEE